MLKTTEVGEYAFTLSPGTARTRSVVSAISRVASACESSAVTEMPTSCRFCSRRWAVTMISARPDESAATFGAGPGESAAAARHETSAMATPTAKGIVETDVGLPCELPVMMDLPIACRSPSLSPGESLLPTHEPCACLVSHRHDHAAFSTDVLTAALFVLPFARVGHPALDAALAAAQHHAGRRACERIGRRRRLKRPFAYS